MLVKNCIIVASLASAAMAQAVGGIFCQARFITNVATCVIGVSECRVVEAFSACVCANTGNKPKLRFCVISLLTDPSFQGTLLSSDYKKIFGSADDENATGDTPTGDTPIGDAPTGDTPTHDDF